MSETPSNPDKFGEVDELYRRMSDEETGGPSEAVRRAVLDHAGRLAAERASADGRPGNVVSIGAAKPRAGRRIGWRPAAVGTLAAAGLAGLLIAPQFLPIHERSETRLAPILVNQPSMAPAAPAAPAEPAAPAYSGPQASPAEPNVAKSQSAGVPAKPATHNKLAQGPVAGDALVARNARSAAVDSAAADSADARTETGRARDQTSSGAYASSAGLPDAVADLRRAAANGDMPALHAALERGPAIDDRDASGRTALMLAVLEGHGEAVDALLAAGADPNAADAQGRTPLKAALDGTQDGIAAALRRAGANP